MPQFEFGMTIFSVTLAHATEHKESLLRLLKVRVILTNEGRSRVLGLSFLNLYAFKNTKTYQLSCSRQA